MSADSQWQALKIALRSEARSMFLSVGDIILVEASKKSDLQLTLTRRGVTLAVTFVPERNEVRWETGKVAGVESVSEPVSELAGTLVRRLLKLP